MTAWAVPAAPRIRGSLYLEMHEEFERRLSGREILEDVRTRTADLAGIGIDVQELEDGPPVGKPVQIQFSGNDKALLAPVVARVRDYLDNEVEGLRDIEDTRSLPGVEWKLSVDRAQAALYNADVSLVGIAVQLVTNGVWVGEYRPDTADDAVDIRVRYPASARGLSALDDLKISTPKGLVPISNFVRREAVPNLDASNASPAVGDVHPRQRRPGVLATTVGESRRGSRHRTDHASHRFGAQEESRSPCLHHRRPWRCPCC